MHLPPQYTRAADAHPRPSTDWQRELNNLARFWMDTSNIPVPPVEAYEADFHTASPDADRDADRIEHDFAP